MMVDDIFTVQVDARLLKLKIALMSEELSSLLITEEQLSELIQYVVIRPTKNTQNPYVRYYADIELPSGITPQHWSTQDWKVLESCVKINVM